MDNICEKPAKLIRQEICNNVNVGSILCSEDIENIRKNMYEARRKVLPRVPRNRIVAISTVKEINPVTCKFENFLFHADEIIFTTYSNLFSCVLRKVDGAQFFQQMFLLHGYKNGYYVPLEFALLPTKNSTTYKTLFKTLITKSSSLQLTTRNSY